MNWSKMLHGRHLRRTTLEALTAFLKGPPSASGCSAGTALGEAHTAPHGWSRSAVTCLPSRSSRELLRRHPSVTISPTGAPDSGFANSCEPLRLGEQSHTLLRASRPPALSSWQSRMEADATRVAHAFTQAIKAGAITLVGVVSVVRRTFPRNPLAQANPMNSPPWKPSGRRRILPFAVLATAMEKRRNDFQSYPYMFTIMVHSGPQVSARHQRSPEEAVQKYGEGDATVRTSRALLVPRGHPASSWRVLVSGSSCSPNEEEQILSASCLTPYRGWSSFPFYRQFLQLDKSQEMGRQQWIVVGLKTADTVSAKSTARRSGSR